MLYLAISLPICILLLHRFPITLTLYKKFETIQAYVPAQEAQPGEPEKLEQIPTGTLESLFQSVNEAFHEIGGHDVN